jgi:hypothetical protein
VDPDRVAVTLRLVIALIGGFLLIYTVAGDGNIFLRMCCLSSLMRGPLQDHAQSTLVVEEYQILRYQGDASDGVVRSSTAQTAEGKAAPALKPIAPLE